MIRGEVFWNIRVVMACSKKASSSAAPEPKRIELSEAEFDALVQRLKENRLSPEDVQLISDIIRAVLWMGEELEQKALSIHRLRRIFAVKTESLANLFPEQHATGSTSAGSDGTPPPNRNETESGAVPPASDPGSKPEPKRPPGHGKLGRDDFPNAKCLFHPHANLKVGDRCPECKRGNLYALDPGTVLRICGQAPFEPVVHQPERLRCSSCGHVFTAALPPEARIDSAHRCDPKARALLALLRYGSGMPMYRIEGLQKALGAPFPASTQWEMLEYLGNLAFPVYRALLQMGRRGELYHNDDTKVRILNLKKRIKQEESERKGIFTSGIVCRLPDSEGGHTVVLFFSGNAHAGENLGRVLKDRPEGLPMPKLMCDALSRNEPEGMTLEVFFCLDHARRNFADLSVKYPAECRYFLETLAPVYANDAKTRAMTDDERLTFHKEKSLPIMEALKAWGAQKIQSKQVEPNSDLGGAIKYFNKHWGRLTGFCRVAGAPLSNALIERLLKRAILHRKNSLFYKTEAGAWIGDTLMSLIETARYAGVNVLDYLTAIQENAEAARASPEKFLPWNYHDTLASTQKAAA